MAARKGTRPPAAGKGRVAGTPNKITRDVKEMILGALSGVGGQKYLEEQAIANPNAFMVLVGKVLPLQVSGEGGGPMILKLIKFGDGDAG
jgi:hypothetical protein